ncbi:spermine synthase [Leucobacter zeae]|nr:spermine synthase [Leucobacter zeae]
MILPAPVALSSGLVAEIEEDRWVPGAIQLLVDGTPQSHVNLQDPSELFFEYIRRIGHVIDLFRLPGAPISALHLGGGAFTLPRYVEATRPGSRQQVVEIEGALVDLVREAAPLPRRASIRVRRGDARAALARLPAGMNGAMDLVVVDIFAGDRTPAHVSSVEFYELLRPLLAPGGLVVVNAADGAGMRFVRSQVATLSRLFGAVAAIAEPQVLKGRRFGNVVLVAAAAGGAAETGALRDADEPTGDAFATDGLDWLPRLLASGPHPARMLVGRELHEFARGAAIVTDATAVDSPAPARELFDRG